MNNTQNNQGEMTTNSNTIASKAFAQFPQAKHVVLTDDVRALSKEQNVQTAAVYSIVSGGSNVVTQCRESFVASGYGTAGDFYSMLCDLLQGKA